jgi:tRNA modification GTPase
MTYDLESTIVAVASPAGGAARGIVRVSGPQALAVAGACFETVDGQPFAARGPTVYAGHALAGALRLPCDLWLWPTSRSYTGQPTAEFHTLGSPPLLESLLAALCQAGARLAGPGEYTLRAFLAGRIDLTQAEAVLGVIDAQGQAALTTALEQLAGGLGRPLTALRGRLLDLLADLEAGLDFADENLEFISSERLSDELASGAAEVAAVARQLEARSGGSELPRVVLVGPPNAGKSSLFNALAGGAKALVSDVAGTTRDYLSAIIECQGQSIELIDTAGQDDDAGPSGPLGGGLGTSAIDETAQQLAQRERSRASVILECRDASEPDEWFEESEPACPRVLVRTKADLLEGGDSLGSGGVFTSSRTGRGLAELRHSIAAALLSRSAEASGVASTAARCGDSLRRAHASLEQARQEAAGGAAELVSAEVRTALDALGEVVGAIYTEDLLDRIFSRFCIGK